MVPVYGTSTYYWTIDSIKLLKYPDVCMIPYKTLVYLNVWEIKVDQGRYFKS